MPPVNAYVPIPWPAWRYHPRQLARVFKSQEEVDAAGPGWVDSPSPEKMAAAKAAITSSIGKTHFIPAELAAAKPDIDKEYERLIAGKTINKKFIDRLPKWSIWVLASKWGLTIPDDPAKITILSLQKLVNAAWLKREAEEKPEEKPNA